jgi:hypothetical protein
LLLASESSTFIYVAGTQKARNLHYVKLSMGIGNESRLSLADLFAGFLKPSPAKPQLLCYCPLRFRARSM